MSSLILRLDHVLEFVITNKLDQYDKGTFLCLLVAYKRKVGGKQLCAATLHCRGKPFLPSSST